MSRKSFFNRSKETAAKATPPQPRAMDVIQKAYQETAMRAGQAQYQVYVHTKDLEQANQALLGLNQEAAYRQKLDQEATKAQDEASDNQKNSLAGV